MKTVSLAYSTREINRNFRIKVSGVDGEGNKVHKLVGVSGAIALIGVEMFNIIEAAFWAGFEPSSDDLTEAALYEEAKAYLEKSIQY